MKLRDGQTVLERFVVEALHDEGGMAEVYRGHHKRLGTPVALKVLYREGDEELVERFNREALMMSKVQHPNVVRILDFGIVNGNLPCIAMEYVEGEPLDMRLVNRGALPWEEAVEIMVGVLAGLEAIHQAQVLHRDLKPENIIVIPSEPEQVKLIDLGIAQSKQIFQENLTQAGETVGTPAYMSPEQLYGLKLDARSDVYSAALVLYELLTDQLPGAAETIKELAARIENPIEPPAAPRGLPPIPDKLRDLVVRCLAADPDERPSTARNFERALREIRRDERRRRHQARQAATGGARKQPTPPRGGAGGAAAPPKRKARPDSNPSNRQATKAGRPFQSGSFRRFDVDQVPRLVLVARMPRKRFKSAEDRGWLSQELQGHGLSFPVEPQFWVATIKGSSDEAAVAEAERFKEAFTDHFGEEGKVAWHPVDGDFTVSPAATHAGGALPPIVEGLLHYVSR